VTLTRPPGSTLFPYTTLFRSTGESSQLYRRQGEQRICVAGAERPMGLRDSIPVGSTLTMLAGSAAQVLLAWEEPDRLHRGLQGADRKSTRLNSSHVKISYAVF